MSDKSSIEWTDATWNPVRVRLKANGKVGWHCEHVTPGCEHCYAESINKRLGTGLPFKPGHRADLEFFLDEKMVELPTTWGKPRMIFTGSMTDLFADFVTDEWLDEIFVRMAVTPQHTYQVLTKRAARMSEYLTALRHFFETNPAPEGETQNRPTRLKFREWILAGMPNLWLGVSVEDQPRADERIPLLLATPASVRFISAEPLLGPVDLTEWLHDSDCHILESGACTCSEPREDHVDWVIVGGESGREARPMHPDWARALRDQCKAAGVAFFFKQWGEWQSFKPLAGGDLGGDMRADRVRFVQKDREPDGHFRKGDVIMRRVGKKAAGRMLDGVTHDQMPVPA